MVIPLPPAKLGLGRTLKRQNLLIAPPTRIDGLFRARAGPLDATRQSGSIANGGANAAYDAGSGNELASRLAPGN
jgi:hypothetical protein